MLPLKKDYLPARDSSALRRALAPLPEVFRFSDHPELAEEMACAGIAREIGTVNDELARFIFDAKTGQPVTLSSLRAERVRWNGSLGVRIYSVESPRLELRARWLHELTHPHFSYSGHDLRQLVIFPRIIARITALQGVDLVLVKSWALNSVLGAFDPAKAYYQTNFWELENNDSLRFSDLLRQGQLVLLGTHDLIAHVAGVRREAWVRLREQAQTVHDALTQYMASKSPLTIASLVLPYTIGVVLDDLAQPPTYGSQSHALALNALLLRLEEEEHAPHGPSVLMRFPPSFERVIQLARQRMTIEDPSALFQAIDELSAELRVYAWQVAR